MSVYISTGGYKNENLNSIFKKLKLNNIYNVELSGGLYKKNILKDLKKQKKINFQIHNYFPVPKKPFVLNLASADPIISKLTMNHVKIQLDYQVK